VRDDLCHEAIRLGRLLAELMPDEPEVLGLLALMLLTEARRGARQALDGSLVLLADQDRTRWDRALASEGRVLLQTALGRRRPGPYQLQAAIAAVHSEAASAADTDWVQLVALYDELLRHQPSPAPQPLGGSVVEAGASRNAAWAWRSWLRRSASSSPSSRIQRSSASTASC